MRTMLFGTVAALLWIGAPAGAATITKVDGRKVVGDLVDYRQDSTRVVVKTQAGTVLIPRREIAHVDLAPAKAESYAEAAKRFPSSAKGQYDFALWLFDNGFRKESRERLEEVIRLDPNHGDARKRLGYRLVNDKWMTRDQEMEAQGYVKHNGKYVLPQERDQQLANAHFKEAERRYFKELRQAWRQLRGDDPEKVAAAREQVRAIRDPEALRPLLEIFAGKESARDDRSLALETIKGIQSPTVPLCVIRLAVDDPSPENRAIAIEILKERKDPRVAPAVARFLKDNDNDKIQRAAEILAEIGDPPVVPSLVDALVTKHRHEHEMTFGEMVAGAKGTRYQPIRTIVLPDGTMVRRRTTPTPANGGGPIVNALPPEQQSIEEEKQNPSVLAALKKLTGQDFGYDKKRWFDWIHAQSRSEGPRKR